MRFGAVFSVLFCSMMSVGSLATGAPQSAPPAVPAPFIASDFKVPTLVEAQGFKLVPLGPDLVDIDYQAYSKRVQQAALR